MPSNTRAKPHAVLATTLSAWLLVLVAGGCADATRATAPLESASFAGVVSATGPSSILLVADRTQPAGADRASVRLHAGTRVLHASGAAASASDLVVGRHVRAWFDGPVMESYPVQASAGTIVIDR